MYEDTTFPSISDSEDSSFPFPWHYLRQAYRVYFVIAVVAHKSVTARTPLYRIERIARIAPRRIHITSDYSTYYNIIHCLLFLIRLKLIIVGNTIIVKFLRNGTIKNVQLTANPLFINVEEENTKTTTLPILGKSILC